MREKKLLAEIAANTRPKPTQTVKGFSTRRAIALNIGSTVPNYTVPVGYVWRNIMFVAEVATSAAVATRQFMVVAVTPDSDYVMGLNVAFPTIVASSYQRGYISDDVHATGTVASPVATVTYPYVTMPKRDWPEDWYFAPELVNVQAGDSCYITFYYDEVEVQ